MVNSKGLTEQPSKRKLLYISLDGPRQRPFLSYYIEWLRIGKRFKNEDRRNVLIEVLTEIKNGTISDKTKARFAHDKMPVPAILIEMISIAALPPDEPEQFIVSTEGDVTTLVSWLEKNEYTVEVREAKY